MAWINNVNPSTLSARAQEDYKAYKEAYAYAKELKAKFESGMNEDFHVPAGKSLIFNYKFGKLSLSVGDAQVKATQPKVDLSQWIAEQAQAGHQV